MKMTIGSESSTGLAIAFALMLQSAGAQERTAAAGSEWKVIDNPGQIDTPSELAEAESSPGALSADDLSRQLSNPNRWFVRSVWNCATRRV